MKKGFIKKLSDSKHVKYTSVNLAFCALVIGIIIVLNAMFSVFSEKFNWFLDMTDEGIFTMSDNFENAVEDALEDKDVTIEIIFPAPKSEVSEAFTLSSSGAMGYINATAEQLDIKFDNIELNYYDIRRDYTFFNENFNSASGTPLSQNVVIVARKNADGSYGEYRVYHQSVFYKKAESTGSIYCYDGEMVFAAAIIGLATDTIPTVYFTMGHGETSFSAWGEGSKPINFENIDSAAEVSSGARELMRIFVQSGYQVLPLNLKTQDIPDDARSIIINAPDNDFTVEELDKLRIYFKESGTIYCFTDHDAELDNLYEFASSYFGATVTPLNATTGTITDTSSAPAGSTGNTFLANVPDNGATQTFFKTIKDFASAKAIVSNANKIDINPLYLTENGYEEGELIMYANALLTTSQNAVLNGEKGVYNIMSLTRGFRPGASTIQSNDSYFLMCTNTSFVSNANLTTNAYANKDMMYALVHTLSAREGVPSLVDIDFKTFINYDLDITEKQANVTTILMVTILPVALAVCGSVIIRRRKLR